MAGAGYRERFHTMLDGLREHPRIEVRYTSLADPATEADLQAAATACGGSLPPDLARFYAEMDGCYLEWAHTLNPDGPRGDRDTGTISIQPIGEVFLQGPARGFLDADPRFRHVLPFDIFVPESCGALMREPDGSVPDETYLHIFGEGSLRTGYGFAAYLDRAFAARGCWSWVSSLCAENQDDDEVAAFRHTLETLFPDVDLSMFRPGPA
ncbi:MULTISPECIES: SMI1/KNR4 family protein [unclassified Streptomyces]|uniref:SMI1/KNR4 family protein n=1 Tax=unclassified Streptomyces TaxID=2593676 RepID=UPI000DAD6FD9|nr:MULTISPECIES: SMI1/KNR4 family protein [unclassified Streptomyces]PZT73343.1 hypothetical protein DNK55_13580 [Streptomyces sp. AC1-42T]PZT83668.1 hypothetical protein DNK56_17845 [Streptomyces sp. AC1-42W]